MTQEPIAVNDTIVNEPGYADQDVVSVLLGGKGLAALRGQMAMRPGRRPILGGVERPERRLTLSTAFLGSGWAADRRAVLRALNSEKGTAKRLLAADQAPPAGLRLALGPWDVYADGGWHARDLIWTDGETPQIVADLSGPLLFTDGPNDRQRALFVQPAGDNRLTNPEFDDDLTDWDSNHTFAVTTEQIHRGKQAVKVTLDGFGGTALVSNQAGVDEPISSSYNEVYHLFGWVYVPSHYDGGDITLDVQGNSGTATVHRKFDGTTSERDAWVLLHTEYETDGTSGSGQFLVDVDGSPSSYAYFYVDDCFISGPDAPHFAFNGGSGPGCSFDSTAHGSFSSATATTVDLDDYAETVLAGRTLSLRFSLVAMLAHDSYWEGSQHYLFDARGDADNKRIEVYYAPGDDKFKVAINGAVMLTSAAQTFDAWDTIELGVTIDFGEDDYRLYVDGSLADSASSGRYRRPYSTMRLGSDYAGANQSHFAFAEFDVYERALGAGEWAALANNGAAHGRARYLEVACEGTENLVVGGRATERGLVSTLLVDDEVRWRYRDGDVHFWRVYAGTGQAIVDVDSDEVARPVFRVTPKTAKTSGFAYRRWASVVWNANEGADGYPVRLALDTATLVSAGKMQSDGDDLRVYVDGVEVDRWLADMNTASTKIWVNLDFEAAVSATLAADIGSGDTVTEIQADDDISGFATEGILLINSEAFSYTDKNNSTRKFTGVTREVRGTTAAAHTAGDTIQWVQHDVWIMYDDSTLGSPDTDDDYQPIFELDSSTNTSWVYEEFGEDDGLRAGAWASATQGEGLGGSSDDPVAYTGNQGADADPWVEIGGKTPQFFELARWYLFNPCGISGGNFTNGEKYAEQNRTYWQGKIQSSEDGTEWQDEYDIAVPSANSTWESWSRNETLVAGAKYLGLTMDNLQNVTGTFYVEAADVTVSLNSTYTPDVTVGSEQENYQLEVLIGNETTGYAIELTFTMGLDETIEVDTAAKLVRLLTDGSRQMQALGLVGGPRTEWLGLEPGENVLTWEETGTQEVEVDLVWERRDLE